MDRGGGTLIVANLVGIGVRCSILANEISRCWQRFLKSENAHNKSSFKT